MNFTRRGFIASAITATAVVLAELRLLKELPIIKAKGNYTFDRATDHYAYGMDLDKPWDVIIYRTDRNGPPRKIVDIDEIHEKAQLQILMPPVEDFDHMANVEELELESIIAMSQGMRGYQMAGNPAFDGPWKDIDEPVSLKIFTTSEEFYADA